MPTLSRDLFKWICTNLGMTTGQFTGELYVPNYRAERTNATFTRQEIMLIDYICKERIKLSLAQLIESFELVYSPYQVAKELGIAHQSARAMCNRFAETNPVPAKKPYIFIWRRDISNVFFSCPLTIHIARNPLWLWRRDNRLSVKAASRKLGLDFRAITRIELGIYYATREDLKFFDISFYYRYTRWFEKYKKLGY